MKTIKILSLLLFLLCVPQLQIDSEAQITMQKCSVCGKPVSNCAYKGNHPKCGVCGKVKENCPYRGNHPKCSTCGKLKEQCQFNGSHPAQIQKETFTVKGISFVMVKVEGGTFQMGSNNGESNEQPVHQVKLSKDYYIGETEVTQVLWYKVMGQLPTTDGPQWEEKYGFGDNYPAYRVSYNDVIRFLTELNKLTGKKFRLPTEAEWEFAAKGGNKSKGYTFSGSNILGDVAWCRSNANSSSHPVKTRKANELGIYDMSGNVCEWCSDFYDNYPSSSQTDPTGPILGSKRVIRRGSWGDNEEKSPVTNRSNLSPDFRSNGMGFRLAL